MWTIVTQSLFIVVALIILNSLHRRVPVNISEFVKDLRQHAWLITAFLIHYISGNAVLRYIVYIYGLSATTLLISIGLGFLVPFAIAVVYWRRPVPQEYLVKRRMVIGMILSMYAISTVGQIVAMLGVSQIIPSLPEAIDTLALLRNVIFRVLIVYVFVGVGEELLFRVAMYELLHKLRLTSENYYVIVSTLVFGLAHFNSVLNSTGVYRTIAIFNVFSVTVFGALAATIYLERKNLLHIAFLHWWLWVGNVGLTVLSEYLIFLRLS